MTEEKYFFEKEVFSRKNYDFTFEFDEFFISELLKHKKSGKVLDLGCGGSGYGLHLAKKGFDVTSVDISKTAIKQLEKEAKTRNLKIKTIIADMENFEFEEKYDIILALGVFHFIPEKELRNLLMKIKKNTTKDGMNIIEAFLERDSSQERDSEGYYFKKQELKEIYKDWQIINYEEYMDNEHKLGFLMVKKIIFKNIGANLINY